MWFKNLQLFRLVKPFSDSAEELRERLAPAAFRRCGSLDLATFGWVSPLGRARQALVHAAHGYLLLAARREEKLLPASVVRAIVQEQVTAIEQVQLRVVGRKERRALHEEVLQDLLPRALTRSRETLAYIAPRDGWLVVDSASRPRAEALASLLRSSLGSLALSAPRVRLSPVSTLTRWLTEGNAPAGFSVEDECELQDPQEGGGRVRCQRQDLSASAIQAHLAAGKQVVQLALTWRDRLAFVLDASLALKRLRCLDLTAEQAPATGVESEDERLDADFSLMTLEFAGLLPALLEAFGGEAEAGAREHLAA